MQKTFKAVKNGDINALTQILQAHPDEIHAVVNITPKSVDGQSLLQVALKSGNLDVADLLLDYHADVNFMEADGCRNDWRMPVLHDAIRCAILCCRWNTKNFITGEYERHSTKEKADKAYGILKRMLKEGANIQNSDSFGNTALERAILDARQVLPTFNYTTNKINDDRMLTYELRNDLSRIFNLLFDHGANSGCNANMMRKSIKEMYDHEPVGEFLL